MHIRKIELTNFRNYDKFKIDNLENISSLTAALLSNGVHNNKFATSLINAIVYPL